ncbi:FeoA family protein [Desulfovibrio sp. JC010]|uniref:ferrous iron transport protein A n=1 Tax=Desulfovibrio sp. JC010 TaxID=2593641 RepID=UPI0013D8DF22|nr:FeoA family protein [Desulfovibrio sp. JC010]NDV26099.1 ferrous iron transport protein A [Desulfovibrio sp. JC010]
MSLTLDKAPVEKNLMLKAIGSDSLKARFERMGLHIGSELEIMSEDSVQHPVRVKGPQGEVLLAAGMASKIIVHHDDGHKTPVFEMNPGEKGHIEGLTAGSHLEKSLKILGISEGDNIELIRCLPPMSYKTVVDGKQTSLTEGMAAKIWGECDNVPCQLATCGRGRPFEVKNILGGPRAAKSISSIGIKPGATVVLETVEPARAVGMTPAARIIIMTKEGLRLHLRPDQAETMLVSEI